MRIKDLPIFRQRTAPLRKYQYYTLGEFVSLYDQSVSMRGQGRGFYDKVYKICKRYLDGQQGEMKDVDSSDEVVPVPQDDIDIEVEQNSDNNMDQSISDGTFIPLYNPEKDIISNIKSSVNEILSYWTENKVSTTDKISKAFQLFFNEELSRKKVESKLGRSNATLLDNAIKKLFYDGEKVAKVRLHPDLVSSIHSVTEEAAYSTVSFFEDLAGDVTGKGGERLPFLEKVFRIYFFESKYTDEALVLPKDVVTKTLYNLKDLILCLRNFAIPKSKDEILKAVKERIDNSKRENGCYDKEFVCRMLSNHPWIKKDEDGAYYLLYEKLDKQNCRFARIIYDNKSFITRKEIEEEYERRYHEKVKFDANQITNRNDFYALGRKAFYYSETGKPLDSMNVAIMNFINTHHEFYWKDMKDMLDEFSRKHNNMPYNESNKRIFVRDSCVTEVGNSDHFVVREYEKDYTQCQWNKPMQVGVTNWAINNAFAILTSYKDYKAPIKEFRAKLLEAAESAGYNKRVIDIIYRHSNKGGLLAEDPYFTRDDDFISIIRERYENLNDLDKEYIGMGLKYPKTYKAMYSFVLEYLREVPSHEILRKDLLPLIQKAYPEAEISQKLIYNAFNDYSRFPNGVTIHTNAEGFKVIRLNVKDASLKDKSNDSAALPWFVQDLQNNLGHYELYLKGISSASTIKAFYNYLKSSTNNLLSKDIFKSYYYYSHLNHDAFMFYRTLSIMSLGYEGLLEDIWHRNGNSGEMVRNMIPRIQAYYPQLQREFDCRSKFGRIMRNIHDVRNRVAHAQDVEISPNWQQITLNDFFALYIFTIQKCLKSCQNR